MRPDRPANQIRSMSRAFVSDVEDRAGITTSSFGKLFSRTCNSRINRFSLNLASGITFPGMLRAIISLPYPYLFDVPGYKVRVVPLSDPSETAIWRC